MLRKFGAFSLFLCDYLDLNESALGKRLCRYAGACGLVCKVGSIYLVKLGKIRHIREKAGGLYNLVKRASRRRENCGKVLANSIRLLLYSSLNHCSRFGIKGDLSRGEYEISYACRLRLRSYCRRRVFGVYLVYHNFSPFIFNIYKLGFSGSRSEHARGTPSAVCVPRICFAKRRSCISHNVQPLI